MKAAKLNQSSLAKRSGVSRDTIWRVLHGKTGATEKNLQKLSDAIGQPLPEVFDAKGPLRVAEGALREWPSRGRVDELSGEDARKVLELRLETAILEGEPVSLTEVGYWLKLARRSATSAARDAAVAASTMDVVEVGQEEAHEDARPQPQLTKKAHRRPASGD